MAAFRRIDVWSGELADTEGRVLEGGLRAQASAACETLVSVDDLLHRAIRAGKLDRPEIAAAALLLETLTQTRLQLAAALLQPSDLDQEDRHGTA